MRGKAKRALFDFCSFGVCVVVFMHGICGSIQDPEKLLFDIRQASVDFGSIQHPVTFRLSRKNIEFHENCSNEMGK